MSSSLTGGLWRGAAFNHKQSQEDERESALDASMDVEGAKTFSTRFKRVNHQLFVRLYSDWCSVHRVMS